MANPRTTVQTISFDTSHLFPVGTTYITRDKRKALTTITGYRVQFDTDTEQMKIEYTTAHEVLGATVKGAAVETTIRMALDAMGVDWRAILEQRTA